MKLLGFNIGREKNVVSTPIPAQSDASVTFNSLPDFVNPYNSVLDVSGNIRDENELIDRYRALVHEVQEVGMAVEEITAEAVITDDESEPVVKLNMEKLELEDQIKELIQEQFDIILSLLKFNTHGYEIFRNWYIDGRIYYHVIVNPEMLQAGILELRYIDSKKIKKVREIIRAPDSENLGLNSIIDVKEYFVYTENPVTEKSSPNQPYQTPISDVPVPMTKDSIAFANSGLLDPSRKFVISYLHDAIRPANNLRMMEDALLIYRLTRAPERRVFYIDTQDLPKAQAEQYVQEQAAKYRTKIVYDSTTGQIKNDKRYISMTEDFWIPRMGGTQGTQIDTLEGGQNLGVTGDADFFLDRLYKSLHVPKSRFAEMPSMFSNGTEITRDEVRFSRFVTRLRSRFSMLFEDLLGKQLVLTGVMLPEEWDEYKTQIVYQFQQDNNFAESMKAMLLQLQLTLLQQVDPFVGKYVSRLWVYQNILDMTEDDMNEIDEQNAEDPWIIAQKEAEEAALVKEESKEEVKTPTLNEDVFDLDFMNESTIELNGVLSDYIKKKLAK